MTQEDQPAIEAILKKMPHLARAGEQALQDLAAIAVLRDIKSGERLITEGEPAEEAYLVASGAVVVRKKGEDGRGRLVAVIGPGSIVGEMALLTRDPRSADVDALLDTQLIALNKKAFDLFRGAGPEIAETLLRDMTRRQRNAMNRFTNANLILLPTRLAITMGDLARDHGTPEGNAIRIAIPLSLQDIADLVVCSPVDIEPVLGDWEGQGYLSRRDGYFTLLKPEEF